MHICEVNKCYFIGYIDAEHPLYVEEIIKDDLFWKNMQIKLDQFYKHCILPEIILQRINKGLLCRDPPYILEAKKKCDVRKSNLVVLINN